MWARGGGRIHGGSVGTLVLGLRDCAAQHHHWPNHNRRQRALSQPLARCGDIVAASAHPIRTLVVHGRPAGAPPRTARRDRDALVCGILHRRRHAPRQAQQCLVGRAISCQGVAAAELAGWRPPPAGSCSPGWSGLLLPHRVGDDWRQMEAGWCCDVTSPPLRGHGRSPPANGAPWPTKEDPVIRRR